MPRKILKSILTESLSDQVVNDTTLPVDEDGNNKYIPNSIFVE